MKHLSIVALVALALVLSGCAPAGAGNPGQVPESNATGNMPVMSGTAETATPGSMMSTGSHMMDAITAPEVKPAAGTEGGQPLAFRVENGVKVFELTTEAVQWPILKDVSATAYTYNGTVPGPMIRVTEGDRVRIVVKNGLSVPTTVHWHGLEVPNNMDGVPGVTQDPIEPGQTFTYEFTARPAGTFWYHSHYEGDVQVGAGLYAPFIVDPKAPEGDLPAVDKTLILSEWLLRSGQTFAAMPMSGMEPNYFTINGRSFPDTETITVRKGDLVRLRLVGAGQLIHPMHLHGLPFKIVATDGHPVPDAVQLTKDTLSIAPGERYDIEFIASEPGQWMLHCHILHHTTNDNVEPGGLMLIVNVLE